MKDPTTGQLGEFLPESGAPAFCSCVRGQSKPRGQAPGRRSKEIKSAPDRSREHLEE